MGTVLRVCGVGLALGSGAMISLDTHGTFTVGGISGGEVVPGVVLVVVVVLLVIIDYSSKQKWNSHFLLRLLSSYDDTSLVYVKYLYIDQYTSKSA